MGAVELIEGPPASAPAEANDFDVVRVIRASFVFRADDILAPPEGRRAADCQTIGKPAARTSTLLATRLRAC
jgi:hypothetical protein